MHKVRPLQVDMSRDNANDSYTTNVEISLVDDNYLMIDWTDDQGEDHFFVVSTAEFFAVLGLIIEEGI